MPPALWLPMGPLGAPDPCPSDLGSAEGCVMCLVGRLCPRLCSPPGGAALCVWEQGVPGIQGTYPRGLVWLCSPLALL